jgi:hypothetical protein
VGFRNGKQRGPFSFDNLFEQIGTKPQLVHLCQEGFENWKPVADVPEVAEELANRARRTPPPPPPKPAPVGLGGWLWFVGIGQVLSLFGSLFLAALGSRFQGKAFLFIGITAMLSFICTILFFHKDRLFPRAFILQLLLQLAIIVFLAANGYADLGGVLTAIVNTAVWTAYVLKSKRVAATFTK